MLHNLELIDVDMLFTIWFIYVYNFNFMNLIKKTHLIETNDVVGIDAPCHLMDVVVQEGRSGNQRHVL